jgi:hypothetical protein
MITIPTMQYAVQIAAWLGLGLLWLGTASISRSAAALLR